VWGLGVGGGRACGGLEGGPVTAALFVIQVQSRAPRSILATLHSHTHTKHRQTTPTTTTKPQGLLPRLMAAAFSLGIHPGPRTLRALLGSCRDLDSRAGLGPFAYAHAPAAQVGGVTLQQVLAAVRAEMAAAEAAAGGGSSGGAAGGGEWVWGGAAERVAAAVMRTLAFERNYGSSSSSISSIVSSSSSDSPSTAAEDELSAEVK